MQIHYLKVDRSLLSSPTFVALARSLVTIYEVKRLVRVSCVYPDAIKPHFQPQWFLGSRGKIKWYMT